MRMLSRIVRCHGMPACISINSALARALIGARLYMRVYAFVAMLVRANNARTGLPHNDGSL